MASESEMIIPVQESLEEQDIKPVQATDCPIHPIRLAIFK